MDVSFQYYTDILPSIALPTDLPGKKKIPSMRVELTTLGLLDPRSNQLSYEGTPKMSNMIIYKLF